MTHEPPAAAEPAADAARTDAHHDTLVRSLELQMELTAIVARGGGIDRLVHGWQQQTGEPLAVFDRLGHPLGRSAGFRPGLLAELGETLGTGRAPRLGEVLRLPEHSLEITPFAGNDVIRGFFARRPSSDESAELAAPTLRSLLALECERHWFLDEPGRRLRAERLGKVLALSDAGGARAILRSSGVELAELRGVVIAARNETHAEVLIDDLAAILATPLIRNRGSVVECLVGADPRRALAEYGLDVPMGVGTSVAPEHAARSMRQARLALETSRRVGTPIEYLDGASHEFLIRVASSEYLDSFADAALAPIEHARGGEVLLQTLHTWLLERRSVEATAERMGVHRHTVRNRIQRIEQLLGHDLDGIDAQTELWLALKARGFREEEPTSPLP